MTRKTQLIVGAAIVAAGVAVSAYLWITREKPAADDAAAQTRTAPRTKSTEPAKMDPAVAGQIRDAYQKNLSDNGPPGMVDLMNGRGGSQTSRSTCRRSIRLWCRPAITCRPTGAGTEFAAAAGRFRSRRRRRREKRQSRKLRKTSAAVAGTERLNGDS